MRTSLLHMLALRLEERLNKDGTSTARIFGMMLALMAWFMLTTVLEWHPYSVQTMAPALAFVLLFGLAHQWWKVRSK